MYVPTLLDAIARGDTVTFATALERGGLLKRYEESHSRRGTPFVKEVPFRQSECAGRRLRRELQERDPDVPQAAAERARVLELCCSGRPEPRVTSVAPAPRPVNGYVMLVAHEHPQHRSVRRQ